ncbi:aldehyde dehydrogenase family protein [Orrella sp. JC864]|uniref:L-piperidine-6-carboxylate dehydrogenase n=1 Tax=Orrella sp. JC864 TaxID=3120298 RepID=UPI00300B1706
MTHALSATSEEARRLLTQLDVDEAQYTGGSLAVCSPIDGQRIAQLPELTAEQARARVADARQAFLAWRKVPAPKRGELVRLLGEELRAAKAELGRLVCIETGKILSEGEGEVQEMIDICEFATGLSRQLYGLTIATERSNHRMMETWHPVGPVAVISAFNFPVAVWAWNAAIALVCGNSLLWKPSEKAPLTALATQALLQRALRKFGAAPDSLSQVLVGGREVGQVLVEDHRIPVVSATGSTAMGRKVGPKVAERFGRAILELGGNNAAIICPSADLELALRAIAFSSMGTAGQRCTTLRRIFVHETVADDLLARLRRVYQSVAVGDPRVSGTLIGPLRDQASFDAMQRSLDAARSAAGQVTGGDRVAVGGHAQAYYVRPALVEMPEQAKVVQHETFAPILYVMRYTDLDEAIALQNDVPQGLSSSIFTNDLREAERFMSAEGSDCGIANVNIGPSGAEIGGAFGGEKETGGGREAGSDSWKAYMRRTTNTVNYGSELPLAQGVKFDVA